MEDELFDETIGSVSSSFLGFDLMSLIEKFLIFIIIFLVVVLILYILIAIFLNKYNKLVNGKGTPLAWIPLCMYIYWEN